MGTSYLQVRSLPSRSEDEFEVVEFEPDQRLSIRGGIGPFEGTLSYILEPVDEGTRLTNPAELEVRGVMRVAAPFCCGKGP